MLMPFGAILSYMAAGAATNLALTGQPPQSLRDYFQPRSGKKDDDGRDIRLSILTPFKDVPNWLSQPGHTTWNKMSPIIHLAQELATNSDYRGVELRNPADSVGQQAADIAKHVGETTLPFSVRAYERLQEAERSPVSGMDKVTRILGDVAQSASGLNPISRYESMSPAEQKAQELMAEKLPAGARTQEQATRSQAIAQLSEARHNNEPDFFKKQREAIAAGTIKQSDADLIQERAKFNSPLERNISHLDIPGAMKVLALADDEEAKRIIPLIAKKIEKSKTLTQADAVKDAAYLRARSK
jgi:hypothetical protein